MARGGGLADEDGSIGQRACQTVEEIAVAYFGGVPPGLRNTVDGGDHNRNGQKQVHQPARQIRMEEMRVQNVRAEFSQAVAPAKAWWFGRDEPTGQA